MNILISSSGRRVTLLKGFISTISELNLDIKVYSSDLNPELAPVSFFSDCIKVGKFTDPNYVSDLIKICLEKKITLIIPTLDSELKLLISNKLLFDKSGIQILISEEKLILECSNKILTKDLFKRYNVTSPKIYDLHKLVFPVFVKPLSGSNSQGIYYANDIDDIPKNDLKNKNLMFMEYMNKDLFYEYTVDAYYSKSSILKCCVPRIRKKIVGGESNQGITVKGDVLDFMKDKFSFFKGAKGCITFQFFVSKLNTTNIYGLEINPRFGGGYPFAFNAGANFQKLIICEYFLNQEIKYSENWKDKCLNLRYEQEVTKVL